MPFLGERQTEAFPGANINNYSVLSTRYMLQPGFVISFIIKHILAYATDTIFFNSLLHEVLIFHL